MMTIRDKLQELIWFTRPIMLVFEWIPFDINSFEELAEELEAKEKERGVLLTDEVDRQPDQFIFERMPPRALVNVRSYEYGNVLVLEGAPIYEEICQKEKMSIRVTSYGGIMYALRVKRVKGCPEGKASLDRLSRAVLDVFEDTSRLMSSLISYYQRRVLNIVYPMLKEEGYERRKYTVLIAEDYEPKFERVEDYLKDPYLPEVRQITGKVVKSFELDGAKVICGENGMLVLGRIDDVEWIRLYSTLRAFEMFLDDLNVYLWMTWDKISEIRKSLVGRSVRDVKGYREELVRISSDISLLTGIKGLVMYAIGKLEEELKKIGDSEPLKTLGASRILEGLKRRGEALSDVFDGIRNEIDGVMMLLNARVEESLDRLNMLTFWLSILLGVFGVGQFASQIFAEMEWDPVANLIVSLLLMGAFVAGSMYWYKFSVARG